MMYADKNIETEVKDFIRAWQVDGLATKEAFVRLHDLLAGKERSCLSFHARPGITCSLRAHIADTDGPLYAMVDVIDDDPEQRWLSVCFYGEQITDPEERGDFVPGGLLGQDAICFDYDAADQELLAYIEGRIAESHAAWLAAASQ